MQRESIVCGHTGNRAYPIPDRCRIRLPFFDNDRSDPITRAEPADPDLMPMGVLSGKKEPLTSIIDECAFPGNNDGSIHLELLACGRGLHPDKSACPDMQFESAIPAGPAGSLVDGDAVTSNDRDEGPVTPEDHPEIGGRYGDHEVPDMARPAIPGGECPGRLDGCNNPLD